MRLLRVLSEYGFVRPMPRWLISLAMKMQAGTRGVAIGVRVVIFDANGAVFLVRHSYMKGWFLPGGGVARGEVPIDAAVREVLEETQIVVKGAPDLHGILLYDKLGVPDYICCYVVRDWHWDRDDGARPEHCSLDGEIVEGDFFPLDQLPDGTTAATRARISEIVSGEAATKMWAVEDGSRA